jgi:hypothetical protein
MTTGFCVDLEPVQRLFPVVEAFGDEGFFTSFDARRVLAALISRSANATEEFTSNLKREGFGFAFRLTRKMTHFAIGQPFVRSKPS